MGLPRSAPLVRKWHISGDKLDTVFPPPQSEIRVSRKRVELRVHELGLVFLAGVSRCGFSIVQGGRKNSAVV